MWNKSIFTIRSDIRILLSGIWLSGKITIRHGPNQNNAHLYFFGKKKIWFTLEFRLGFSSRQKLLKVTTYITKTKNCTKNIIYAKNERQINSNLP